MPHTPIVAKKSRAALRARLKAGLLDSSGQSLIEAIIVLPLLILLVFGVVELGTALRNQHVVTRLSREGSNLISRSTTLEDAALTLTTVGSGSVNFSTNSRMIFSVLKRGATVGSANYNQLVLYKRYSPSGPYAATSRLTTLGSPTFGGAPDYLAVDSDSDTDLRITNAPAGIAAEAGGLSYVTEIFSSNPLTTPLAKWGIAAPQELYSIAYF